MKRALVIRNVSHHDVPVDSLDNACVQAFTANGFITEIAVLHESDIRHQLMQTHARGSYYAPNNGGNHHSGHASSSSSSSSSPPSPFDVVLFRAAGLPAQRVLSVIKMVRTISRQLFLCVFSSQLVENPLGRYECFQEGASMVTCSMDDIHNVTRFIGSCADHSNSNSNTNANPNGYRHLSNGQPTTYTCPICAKSGFSEDQLWRHCPMYHINDANRDDLTCPICRQSTRGPFQVHLHNAHGPPGRGEMASEFTMGESVLYSFALVVCHNRKYNTFLLVQEFANSGYWLPGGRIDSGENPAQAAIRETKEEAGIDIRLTGVIKIEYHPKKERRSGNNYVRMRFIFYAEPLDCDQLPKSIPDYESAGATWCKADQVASLPLRGPEPTVYFTYVAAGKPIFPIDMIQVSSTPAGSPKNSSSSSSNSNRRHH